MKELFASLTDATIAVGILVAVPLAALNRTTPAIAFALVLCAAAAMRFAYQRTR